MDFPWRKSKIISKSKIVCIYIYKYVYISDPFIPPGLPKNVSSQALDHLQSFRHRHQPFSQALLQQSHPCPEGAAARGELFGRGGLVDLHGVVAWETARGWMDGWLDLWMDGCMYACMYACGFLPTYGLGVGNQMGTILRQQWFYHRIFLDSRDDFLAGHV